ncbi:MAG TPA: hypothetical protein VNV87_12815 [Acidimicrobiales bacterium]|nr:hypothetical protein [Acidimicrobiales bacterium]
MLTEHIRAIYPTTIRADGYFLGKGMTLPIRTQWDIGGGRPSMVRGSRVFAFTTSATSMRVG